MSPPRRSGRFCCLSARLHAPPLLRYPLSPSPQQQHCLRALQGLASHQGNASRSSLSPQSSPLQNMSVGHAQAAQPPHTLSLAVAEHRAAPPLAPPPYHMQDPAGAPPSGAAQVAQGTARQDSRQGLQLTRGNGFVRPPPRSGGTKSTGAECVCSRQYALSRTSFLVGWQLRSGRTQFCALLQRQQLGSSS